MDATRVTDRFDVDHPGLNAPFSFSSSDDLDTVGITVRDQGLAAYEAPVTDILIELVRGSPGVVLDVGANTGLYALAAAAAHRLVEVIAFEPLEPVRDLLRRNLALNPELASRITIEPFGLSNDVGSVSFYETINDRGFVSTSSSLEHHHVQAVGGDHIERVINTITLDSFARKLGDKAVSFLKIDVEGHEHAVIAGGREFLRRHRPIFTVELLGHAERGPMDDLLIDANYLAFAIAPVTLRQCERMMFFHDAWNYLIVPTEKLDRVFALCRKLELGIELR